MLHLSNPWKYQKKLQFPDVFRENTNITLGRNYREKKTLDNSKFVSPFTEDIVNVKFKSSSSHCFAVSLKILWRPWRFNERFPGVRCNLQTNNPLCGGTQLENNGEGAQTYLEPSQTSTFELYKYYFGRCSSELA